MSGSLANETTRVLRSLWRCPGFWMVAILTLGLGIALNVSVFAVLEGSILGPLPFRDPDRVAVLSVDVPTKGIEGDWTSYPAILDWQSESTSFDEFAVELRVDSATVVRDEPTRIKVARVSASLFPVLGVAPVQGRTYTATEEARRDPVVVISHGYWQREFGGAADIVGQTFQVDRKRAMIVGVMPPGFAFPSEDTQIWLPLTYIAQWPAFLEARQADAFRGIARLREGVSIEQARAEMSAIAAELALRHPVTDAGKTVRLIPITDEIVPKRTRQALWLLMGAALLVLLVVCSNVAALFLARGNERSGELAVRVALGASLSRLLWSRIVEVLAVALAAGLLGLGLAAATLRVLVSVLPDQLPRLGAVRIDPVVVLGTFALSVLAALATGLAPVLATSRIRPLAALRHSSRTIAGRGRQRARKVLVAGQFAVATLLLAGAGLLLLSYLKLQTVDIGMRTEHILLAPIELPGWFSGDLSRPLAYFDEVIRAVGSVPGVATVAVTSNVFSTYVPNNVIAIEGRPPPAAGADREPSIYSKITEDYFRVMGIPLLEGRQFSAQDHANTPPVAVVNRTMAGRFWPGESPIGKRFRFGVPGERPGAWINVVGVAGDTLPNGPESRPVSQFYVPLRQRPWSGSIEVVARTVADPLVVSQAVRHAIRSVNPTVPGFEMTSVEQRLGELGAQRRLGTWFLTGFAALALLLAALGIYGLLHYWVGQHVHEIGVRRALGARPISILRLVARKGLSLACIGVFAGLAAAVGLAQLLSSLLWEIDARDPLALACVAAVLLSAAAAASLIPARRAIQAEPAEVLKHE